MARHKTAHRKRLEADNKAKVAARGELLASSSEDLSLKPNAAANAKRFGKAASKSK